jgi:hypothetical protein
MENIENLKQQIEVLSKMGLDTSRLQQQLDELESPANNPSVELSEAEHDETTPLIKVVPVIQAQEKGLDEDIGEPSETQKIAVAPTIEIHQSAWTLACCYLWLTSRNLSERKGVVFTTPRPFQELANMNLLCEVLEEAEWTTWNRLLGKALDNFLLSGGHMKDFESSLKDVMCLHPAWWKDKYLASCET